jgi:hypothetical protein
MIFRIVLYEKNYLERSSSTIRGRVGVLGLSPNVREPDRGKFGVLGVLGLSGLASARGSTITRFSFFIFHSRQTYLKVFCQTQDFSE